MWAFTTEYPSMSNILCLVACLLTCVAVCSSSREKENTLKTILNNFNDGEIDRETFKHIPRMEILDGQFLISKIEITNENYKNYWHLAERIYDLYIHAIDVVETGKGRPKYVDEQQMITWTERLKSLHKEAVRKLFSYFSDQMNIWVGRKQETKKTKNDLNVPVKIITKKELVKNPKLEKRTAGVGAIVALGSGLRSHVKDKYSKNRKMNEK